MDVKDIFNPNTLNIFCDASILKKNEEVIGCPGCVCVETHPDYSFRIIDEASYIVRNSTNNDSELRAILLGIHKAIRYRDRFQVINLFSDSKLCIHTLKYWIFNWINNVENGKMINSSSKPVSNQNMIMTIINEIMNNNLYINLYHQKGHVSIINNESLANAIRVFKETNYINDIITKELMYNLSYYNDYVDVMTKNVLRNIQILDIYNLTNPINLAPKRLDILNKYKNFIGNI